MPGRETRGMRVEYLIVRMGRGVGYLIVRMGRGVGYLIVRMGRGVGYLIVRMGGRDMRMVGLAVVNTLLHLIFGSQELQILLRLMLGSFHVLDSLLHRLFLPQVILGCVNVCGYVSMCVCVWGGGGMGIGWVYV